jgi:hypothetical protein
LGRRVVAPHNGNCRVDLHEHCAIVTQRASAG